MLQGENCSRSSQSGQHMSQRCKARSANDHAVSTLLHHKHLQAAQAAHAADACLKHQLGPGCRCTGQLALNAPGAGRYEGTAMAISLLYVARLAVTLVCMHYSKVQLASNRDWPRALRLFGPRTMVASPLAA